MNGPKECPFVIASYYPFCHLLVAEWPQSIRRISRFLCIHHNWPFCRNSDATMCDRLRSIYSTSIQSKKETSKGTAPRKRDYTGTAIHKWKENNKSSISFRVMSSGGASRRSQVPWCRPRSHRYPRPASFLPAAPCNDVWPIAQHQRELWMGNFET